MNLQKKAEDYRKKAKDLVDDNPRKAELETKAKQIDKNLRIFDGITSALYAPNSNGIIGDVTRAASPQLAYRIGQEFKRKDQEGSAQHLLAHAILGAAVSYATGNNITTGALSGAGSEVAAPALANYLYDTKDPSELNQEQKDTIVSILDLATVTTAYTATDGNVADTVSGAEIGKVGVEWNGTVVVNAGINTTPIKGKGGELAVFVTSSDAFENFSIRNPKINWGKFDAGVAVTTSDITGFGAGFGLGANYIQGGRSNIDDTSSTASTCLLVGCFNIHNDSSGKYSGYGGAIGGNSKGGVAPRGSFTYSDNKTRTLTIRDVF